MNSLPPFYVGQRVVCVDVSSGEHCGYIMPSDVLNIGDEFTVMGIRKSCCKWVVDIGITNEATVNICVVCGNAHKKDSRAWWIAAFRFAPISENFQSISLEKVLEEETKLISVN